MHLISLVSAMLLLFRIEKNERIPGLAIRTVKLAGAKVGQDIG